MTALKTSETMDCSAPNQEGHTDVALATLCLQVGKDSARLIMELETVKKGHGQFGIKNVTRVLCLLAVAFALRSAPKALVI